MSHTWLGHVCDLTHSLLETSHITPVNESCHTQDWVMTHLFLFLDEYRPIVDETFNSPNLLFSFLRQGSFICATCITYMCAVIHRITWMSIVPELMWIFCHLIFHSLYFMAAGCVCLFFLRPVTYEFIYIKFMWAWVVSRGNSSVTWSFISVYIYIYICMYIYI